jgi:demethylmenaquinone methyltransferase/2-methoxy-6-polyprenyl-1,4-benzoquinol methylase
MMTIISAMPPLANNSNSQLAKPAASAAGGAGAAWTDSLLRDPHHAPDKRQRVQKMFAAIAPSYDLNNRLHSLWQDQRWRGRAVKLAKLRETDVVVDVACGTGDLTIAMAHGLWPNLGDWPPARGQAIGIDFTFDMLPLARTKARRFVEGKLSGRTLTTDDYMVWLNGDAQSLPLPDACCDVVSIAFGIRNVQDPASALREFRRVLRTGGRVIVLEFSLPTNRVLRGLYNFYFRQILPRTATWISRDRTGAYKYLPESVNTFITPQKMVQMMREAGFENVEQFPMSFGVCLCYRGFVHANEVEVSRS